MTADTRRGNQNCLQIGPRRRAGLTTMEFVSCVTAVLGGAWIGALYLGVDIQHVAYTALEQAQLLESIPADWRPAKPKTNMVTREQLAATLRKELGTLRSELIALRSGQGRDPSETSDLVAVAKEHTRNYWQRLSEIALNEEAFQRDAESAFNDANASKVFAIKGRICRFAAKAIESLPVEGVDESVVKFGRQLGLWYDRAGELYERATRLWETPTGKQARVELNEEWKRAETQHRHEARLINARAAAVRSSMSRQFGEEFVEFAKPAENAAATDASAPSATPAQASQMPAETSTPAPPAATTSPADAVSTPEEPVTVPPVVAPNSSTTTAPAN